MYTPWNLEKKGVVGKKGKEKKREGGKVKGLNGISVGIALYEACMYIHRFKNCCLSLGGERWRGGGEGAGWRGGEDVKRWRDVKRYREVQVQGCRGLEGEGGGGLCLCVHACVK